MPPTRGPPAALTVRPEKFLKGRAAQLGVLGNRLRESQPDNFVVLLMPVSRSAAALCRARTPPLRSATTTGTLSRRCAKGFPLFPWLLHNVLHVP